MRLVLLFVLAAALPACSGCKKNKEPDRDQSFDPTTADAHAPAVASSVAPRDAGSPASGALTPKERRDVQTRIEHTQCEEAAKHANLVRGRAETDPKGIDLLSGCLKWGNVAWYVCTMAAKTPPVLQSCGERLLLPPDEIPK
jgi:hypothetical protein